MEPGKVQSQVGGIHHQVGSKEEKVGDLKQCLESKEHKSESDQTKGGKLKNKQVTNQKQKVKIKQP